MDAEERLKKYIAPARRGRIFGFIALAVGLLGAVMLVLGLNADPGKPTEFSSNGNGTSKWAYLDVAGISDWVFKDDGKVYYLAEDVYGNFSVVRLPDSTYKKMTQQRAYWNEETSKPVPMRITGVPRNATSTIREYICKAADIPSVSYRTYFGTEYLDAASKPGTDDAYVWALPAIFGLILALILLPTYGAASKNAARRLAGLGSYELQQAAAELESPVTRQENGDRLRLGEHYIFGKRNGLLLPYERVFWVYERVQRTNFVVTGRHLMLADDTGALTVAAAFGRKGEEEIRRLIGEIARRNPGVRVGFSAENQKAWRELTRERKGA